jgi:Kef-type K+ transport system membrane component KefB
VEPVQLAAVLAVLVLVASMASVELGVTVALIELTLGVVAGNVLDLQSQEWLDFVAAFASIGLTFLAGMEVDTAPRRPSVSASSPSPAPSWSRRSSATWGSTGRAAPR